MPDGSNADLGTADLLRAKHITFQVISTRPQCELAILCGMWTERKIVGIKTFLFTVPPDEVFPTAHRRKRCFLCKRLLKKNGEILKCRDCDNREIQI